MRVQFTARYNQPIKLSTDQSPIPNPHQRCNLASAHPDIVAQLLERLEAYNRTSVPARFPPPTELCDPSRSHNVFTAWGEEEL